MVAESKVENVQNLCPVCGFQMDDPPVNYNICPSCGTEFGVHDVNSSIEQLREAWIQSGPKWWSTTDPQPEGWDPYVQLGQLGLASGAVVGTTNVVRVVSTTSSQGPPLSGGWLGVGERPWDQSVNRQFSLGSR